MSEFPLTLEIIVGWLRSKDRALADSGVKFAEIRESQEHLPSACADFDAAKTMGRISAWVSGCFDFEVLCIADGKDVLFRHERVSTVEAPDLENAYADFIRHMLNPSGLPGDAAETSSVGGDRNGS